MGAYAEIMAAQAEARGDVEDARRWRYVGALVDAAPPLSAAKRDRLRILLHPRTPPTPRTRTEPSDDEA
jgi:hypothetical protein